MKFTVDSEAQTLAIDGAEMPLYSPEAFRILSREWVRVGWAVQQYFTFSWFGRPILQLPEDLVRVQEAIVALQPDVIVETGIYDGGSLLFYATLLEGLGKGRVIGIDQRINEATRTAVMANRLAHRVTMLEGDSAAAESVATIAGMIQPGEKVLVLLDSAHTKAHVARELEAYAPLVTPGSCIVVTDGVMRELWDVPGGEVSWREDNPCAAAEEFLATHAEFELRQPEWPFNKSNLSAADGWPLTYWPDGWLWRKVQ